MFALRRVWLRRTEGSEVSDRHDVFGSTRDKLAVFHQIRQMLDGFEFVEPCSDEADVIRTIQELVGVPVGERCDCHKKDY